MTRTSWYLCAQCKQPHTQEQPLVVYGVTTDRKANWHIHEHCLPALQATLIEGVELERVA